MHAGGKIREKWIVQECLKETSKCVRSRSFGIIGVAVTRTEEKPGPKT